MKNKGKHSKTKNRTQIIREAKRGKQEKEKVITKRARNYKMDNIRLILIFLVIFGHFLEFYRNDVNANNLYRIIYSFHMPAFIFITGFFAKFKIKKIIKYVLLYIVFQILYCNYVHTGIQFETPYWILWYLFLMPVYYLLVPIINRKNNVIKTIILLSTVGLSLMAGYNNNIGYLYSLSRFFTFLPFFILGYYVGHNKIKLPKAKAVKYITNIAKIMSIIAVCFCTYYIFTNTWINAEILQGSYSYEAKAYNPTIKLGVMFIAICWIIFLMLCIPNKKIKCITVIGQNTLYIYLLHGFILRNPKTAGLFHYSLKGNLVLNLCLTIASIISIFAIQSIIEGIINLIKKGMKRMKRKVGMEETT